MTALRAASKISFDNSKSSTARAKIIAPTKVDHVANACFCFAALDRPGMTDTTTSTSERNRIARFLAKVFHTKRRDYDMHPTVVNGDPGVVFTLQGNVVHFAALRVEDGVRGVYMCLNPEKLTRWSVAKLK